MAIIIDFRYDRWEVIQRYGFREILLAFFSNREDALEYAALYRKLEREVC